MDVASHAEVAMIAVSQSAPVAPDASTSEAITPLQVSDGPALLPRSTIRVEPAPTAIQSAPTSETPAPPVAAKQAQLGDAKLGAVSRAKRASPAEAANHAKARHSAQASALAQSSLQQTSTLGMSSALTGCIKTAQVVQITMDCHFPSARGSADPRCASMRCIPLIATAIRFHTARPSASPLDSISSARWDTTVAASAPCRLIARCAARRCRGWSCAEHSAPSAPRIMVCGLSDGGVKLREGVCREDRSLARKGVPPRWPPV